MLAAARRVTRQGDWHRAHRFGRIFRAPEVTMKVVQNAGKATRFGFSVSVKVAKRATERNTMKRRLRAAVAGQLPGVIRGYDVILVARHQLRGMPTADISRRIEELFRRARLIHHHNSNE